jgi:hypothetical protein
MSSSNLGPPVRDLVEPATETMLIYKNIQKKLDFFLNKKKYPTPLFITLALSHLVVNVIVTVDNYSRLLI